MPSTAQPTRPMRAIAYMRRSQDSGTGVSEEIQDEAIREYVERKGGEMAYWLPADLDASSWTLDRPSMQKALQLLAAGKADTLVVAKLSRVTRRPRDWEQLLDLMDDEGWTIRSADFDLDLATRGGRMIARVLIAFLGGEYEEKRDAYDDARRNAVLVHAVHGGERAPLGYTFTTRGSDRRGRDLRGPLAANADAEKVQAAFQARAEGAGWREVVQILGVASQGAASNVIRNRVYLGEARSGDYVKPNAHPALVDEQLWQRANRKKTQRSVAYAGRPGALLGGKIMRCGTCGYSLTRDATPKGHVYRCKNVNCTQRASVMAALVEPHVLWNALVWHATLGPMHQLEADLNAAAVPVYEGELAAAQAQLAEVEAAFEAGDLTPVAYGKALTAAELAVQAAAATLAEVEASKGWHGMTTEAVQRRLFKPEALTVDAEGHTVGAGPAPDPAQLADVEAAREFVRQMVRVVVHPVGRGRKVPVEQRVTIEQLTPTAVEEEAYVVLEATPILGGAA